MTMIGTGPDRPAGIDLLADHLDTALAIGEDLTALVLPPRADLDNADPETAPEAIDRFVHRIRELELALLVRLLQARRRAVDIGRADGALRPAASLFRAETALLAEMIEKAPQELQPADAGADSIAYLRARALLSPEAAAPSPYESVAVTEAFLVGGIAPLGGLLDLVASLLDLVDARFGLYSPPHGDEALEDAEPEAAADDVLQAPGEGIAAAGPPEPETAQAGIEPALAAEAPEAPRASDAPA